MEDLKEDSKLLSLTMTGCFCFPFSFDSCFLGVFSTDYFQFPKSLHGWGARKISFISFHFENATSYLHSAIAKGYLEMFLSDHDYKAQYFPHRPDVVAENPTISVTTTTKGLVCPPSSILKVCKNTSNWYGLIPLICTQTRTFHKKF